MALLTNILQQRLGYMLMFTRRGFYYVYSVNFTLNKPNVLAIKILIRPITSFLFSLSETVRERESGENKMNPSRALSKFGVNIFWRMLLLSTIGSYTCIHLREWMNLLLAFTCIHLKLYSLKFLKLYESTGGTVLPNIQTISKQIAIKTDMKTVVTQNVTLLKFVHSYEIYICQMNSTFILIRFIHNFTKVLCFLYWQMNVRYILIVFKFNTGVEWRNFNICTSKPHVE